MCGNIGGRVSVQKKKRATLLFQCVRAARVIEALRVPPHRHRQTVVNVGVRRREDVLFITSGGTSN